VSTRDSGLGSLDSLVIGSGIGAKENSSSNNSSRPFSSSQSNRGGLLNRYDWSIINLISNGIIIVIYLNLYYYYLLFNYIIRSFLNYIINFFKLDIINKDNSIPELGQIHSKIWVLQARSWHLLKAKKELKSQNPLKSGK